MELHYFLVLNLFEKDKKIDYKTDNIYTISIWQLFKSGIIGKMFCIHKVDLFIHSLKMDLQGKTSNTTRVLRTIGIDLFYRKEKEKMT